MKLLIGSVLVLGILGVIFWPHSLTRVTIVVASNPVSLWSWDTKTGTFVVLKIPADVVVSGVDGYGSYSLEALWKLGFIDGKEGNVLSQSLERAIAVRTPYYLGEKSDSLVSTSDIIEYGKRFFSFRKRLTNIPLRMFLSFFWALQRARLDAIRVIDLSDTSVSISEELSDNTTREVLDAGRLDAALKGVYEDELLASENTTVAVYNTTTTPSLGTQAARMLTNLGIRVVAVGNASPSLKGCTLSGTKQAVDTKTAALIKTFFSCDVVVQTQQERADLTIHLGGG